MSDYEFKQVDFEHPSSLFVLEDVLKGLLGGPLLYGPYMKTFALKGDERVLDFGCGGGAGSAYLARLLSRNGHLTCVDVSAYWIERARKRLRKYPNVECRAGDIRELDIADSSFDVVSVFHVIHDIAPAERQGTVDALSRKLNPGGRLFIREPIKTSHGMPADEIRALMSGAGLKETEHRQTKSEYSGRFEKTPPGA